MNIMKYKIEYKPMVKVHPSGRGEIPHWR